MELKSLQERLAEIQKLSRLANLTAESELIISLPVNYATEWSQTIGTTLNIGSLVAHNGVKYLVMQTIVPTESQSPDSVGMLAIYKPYQGEQGYPWIYGEYCKVGFTRFYEGVLYKAIQDPAANIYAPNVAPAIWELAQEEI